MAFENIRHNVAKILEEIPESVELVAAAKTRTPEEIQEAIAAGVGTIGENYVQEAARAFGIIGRDVKWHFIGHLQKNKVKKAVEVFDLIETVDSASIAEEIDKRSRAINKIMPVLIEVNSGREPQKHGVFPEDVRKLVEAVAVLPNIKIKGLMTMGPFSGNPEDARPYFVETRKTFGRIKALGLCNVEMDTLSMGMTNSYHVAIEEGANVIRVGTKIFGER
ncbi:MAG: YggS family pyridoxal phosphate-dependent enzyme [Candidatus Omnitrophica bacterium]|nr:YggS family pyridoxal phosphate-dependent enzyme [Candidatus Omnitrophota bacterium]